MLKHTRLIDRVIEEKDPDESLLLMVNLIYSNFKYNNFFVTNIQQLNYYQLHAIRMQFELEEFLIPEIPFNSNDYGPDRFSAHKNQHGAIIFNSGTNASKVIPHIMHEIVYEQKLNERYNIDKFSTRYNNFHCLLDRSNFLVQNTSLDPRMISINLTDTYRNISYAFKDRLCQDLRVFALCVCHSEEEAEGYVNMCNRNIMYLKDLWVEHSAIEYLLLKNK